jgi:hypothetical protein
MKATLLGLSFFLPFFFFQAYEAGDGGFSASSEQYKHYMEFKNEVERWCLSGG